MAAALAATRKLYSTPSSAEPFAYCCNVQFSLALPERVVAMDVRYPLLLCGTSDKKIYIFHLDNPQKPYRVRNNDGDGGDVRYCSNSGMCNNIAESSSCLEHFPPHDGECHPVLPSANPLSSLF